MDMQMLIVIACVALAAAYVVRRMCRAARRGSCDCCSGGAGMKSRCACGRARPQAGNDAAQAAPVKALMEKELGIGGMRCAHCEAQVRQALAAVQGVVAVTASHSREAATVRLSRDVPDSTLAQAVTKAGYAFRGVSAARPLPS